MDTSRRAFLRGSLLTRDGRSRELRHRQPLGPPPPWLDRLPLEAHCPDCPHPCARACETGIIGIHPPEHSLAGIPWLDFRNAGCTFCAACVDACPVQGAVPDRNGPAPRLGEASVNRDTCLAWNGVICQSCVGRCPERAISINHHREAHIDTAQCKGCGMCISACPVNALQVVCSAAG